MQLILTGATGLVGSGVLHHILSLTPTAAATKRLSSVSIVSRKPEIPLLTHPLRPTTNEHTDIKVLTHPDFAVYPDSLLSKLKAASESDESVAVVWALGMSQNDATSTEQYIEVTKTYALNAARAFATGFAPRRVNFVYVSGEGANKSPGMFTPLFGKVKGETETELLALAQKPEYANLRVYNVRPAGVDAGGKGEGSQPAVDELTRARTGGSKLQKAAREMLLPVVRVGAGLWSSIYSPTEELGKVFVGLGLGDGKPVATGEGVEDGGWTLRNTALRRLAKEMA